MSKDTAKALNDQEVLNVYIPEKQDYKENCILLGYNFENSTIVISSIIPCSKI
jgi:hypothetical protein